jgi:hypothetical protein
MKSDKTYSCYLLVGGCVKRGYTLCGEDTLEVTKAWLRRLSKTARFNGLNTRVVIEGPFETKGA